jgi:2-C-methyl-D-erythritol 2,4-cyclodiphosphate synthase
MDALLGAAGLGDIGVHFPPSDERWRNARSLDLLAIVRDLLPVGWTIENIDATILAEAPKIGPYREAMRAALAGVLGIAPERVNIKATTNERLGFIGRGEGIAALASAALRPSGGE